ncbi:MAG: ComEC/Rec2 family competence protein [Bacteroidota bacterium]|nr:ComEC/Rec2 family competence protein [Bacteroidota bacterium]
MAQIPALRLGILSLVSAACAFALPVPWNSGLVALTLCGMLLIAIFLLWWRQIVLCYAIAAIGIGVSLASAWRRALPPMTDAVVQPFPAYVEGRIVDILRVQPPRLRCIVEGQVDAQPLPPMQARVLLSIAGTAGTEPWAQPGHTIRASIRIRPPRPAVLPTDFPEWDYCAHLDVQWVGFARASDVSLWEEQPRSRTDLLEFLAHQRQRLRQWIADLYPSDVRPLALALLVGDRSELAPQQRREFALTGVSHVLAISGLHIGVLAGMVLVVVGFFPWRWLQWLLFSGMVALCVALTGAQPSALRAGVMATLGWAAYLLQRQPQPINIVAAVALFLLIISPELAFSRSFQLSVLATLGIVGFFDSFSRWLQQHVRWLPKAVVHMVALTLSATCTSAPVAAWAFGIFSLVSVPLNLLAVPLSSAALISGVLGLLAYPLLPELGHLYSGGAQLCLRGLDWIVRHVAQAPMVALEGHTAVAAGLGSSFLLLWLLTARRWQHVLFRVGVAGLVTVLGASWSTPRVETLLVPRDRLVAAFLPTALDSLLVVLVDRFPNQKPRSDPALEQYLHEFSGHLRIAYTGYTSELIAMRCIRLRPNTSAAPAPPPLLEYTHRLFQLRMPLPQVAHPVRLSELEGIQ